MRMYDTPHPLGDYLNHTFTCPCGRTHSAPLRQVTVGPGALEALPVFVREQGFHSVFLICDAVTRDIAGERCRALLEAAGIPVKLHCLVHTGYDEATLGELLIQVPADCGLCAAVGTGAINDMTRFFSFRTGHPFLTVATAAPMDGFASSLAVLNINHLKTSIQAQSPIAVFGDTDILKNAPYPMIAAGLGDLLGKCTCLCDWKLARLINGEHYCERLAELVEDCVTRVLRDAERAKDRDGEVIGEIMDGLVLAGTAISLYGSSRPASGCEHHISHYWEMVFEQAGKKPAPHGIQVGVGTVLILRLAEALRETEVDFRAAREAAERYDPRDWEARMQRAYGSAAPGILELERTAGKNETASRLRRIRRMEAHWPEVLALLEALPSSRTVMELLRSLEAPCLPAEIGVDEELLRRTLLCCKEVRARYTLLQLLWDLDLLEPLTERVAAESRP